MEKTERSMKRKKIKVYDYCIERAEELNNQGRKNTSNKYRYYGDKFKQYFGDMALQDLNRGVIIDWKDKMLADGLCRNTVNFYIRGLKAIYNRAVMLELIKDNKPFYMVSSATQKTVKRAITAEILRKVANYDCEGKKPLELARDMFLLSFYLCGMSPIDMQRLTTENIKGNYIVYKRSKTSQELSIRIEKEAQAIFDKYKLSCWGNTLVPAQTKGEWERINKALRTIGKEIGVPFPLTMYCARHTWATLSQRIGAPIEVISKGLGHDNVQTTAIYLASIETPIVDKYNKKLIDNILKG